MSPVDVMSGTTFFQAAKSLQPVDETMRVGIDLGKVTEEKKNAVLTGAFRLSDFGNVKVQVCKSRTECIPMIYSGPYFSRKSFGIGFEASGKQLEHSMFVGVTVSVDRPLRGIAISWSNYSQ